MKRERRERKAQQLVPQHSEVAYEGLKCDLQSILPRELLHRPQVRLLKYINYFAISMTATELQLCLVVLGIEPDVFGAFGVKGFCFVFV